MLLHRISQSIDHFIPDLNQTFNGIADYRGGRATYEISEIMMAAIFMFLFKQGSRNQTNEDREEAQFRSNYKFIFGLNLPHLVTVNDVMKKLDPEMLESCRGHIIKYIEQTHPA